MIQQGALQRQGALNDRLRSLHAEERQAQGELDTNRLRAQLAIKSQQTVAEAEGLAIWLLPRFVADFALAWLGVR